MKAITCRQYGGPEVLKFEDIDQPEPKAGEVRVRVHSTTVTAGAVLARLGRHPDFKAFTVILRLFFGVFKPRKAITGYEFAGVVESLGKDVKTYKVGDRVFGTTTGLKQGSYAEFVCVPVSWKQGVMATLPQSMSFDEGAALPVGAMTAYDLFKKVTISQGSEVMIYGASGSVGTYMIQLAKSRGGHVTAVSSKKNHGLLKKLGADEVLDYKGDAYKNLNKKFDLIGDAVGKMAKEDKKRFMDKSSDFISISTPTKEEVEGLEAMTKLVTEGSIQVHIDKIYSMNEIQEAHAYAESGHKRGNLVVRIL